VALPVALLAASATTSRHRQALFGMPALLATTGLVAFIVRTPALVGAQLDTIARRDRPLPALLAGCALLEGMVVVRVRQHHAPGQLLLGTAATPELLRSLAALGVVLLDSAPVARPAAPRAPLPLVITPVRTVCQPPRALVKPSVPPGTFAPVACDTNAPPGDGGRAREGLHRHTALVL